ncbi:substrate-binding domain-containing protein [Streptomyces acidiscabies]|uniref:Substrate-binding domain-containing protein n=2 Tax=Streptomyces acidiscabies TaxID=42234 RepID=A0AAP6EJQ5_9ACTN|nr:substrate-binding domain-containing protein [Streptomyces acidiscabies]MDX2965254.1 substrate-binding domain-containing protein [Streptomyces acidiscabies]MDX3022130.1 substrate-binding domain-containing protein [Streptomyces acidiscabies]MDX3795393.1 substrate-binding domain-containing protein [Streptomyces acidiscabies]GAQ51834.1 DNA-binding transcriptional regulator CytR [Streptomyces acidiscabies]
MKCGWTTTTWPRPVACSTIWPPRGPAGSLSWPGRERSTTRARVAAYTEWCRRRGQLPQVVQNTLSPHPDGPLDRVLASPERPDAVFGIYDYCGRRALTSAARLGLRVPEDLLVVCASEDPSYASCDPPVSTLSLAPGISLPAAVTALIDVIETAGHTSGTAATEVGWMSCRRTVPSPRRTVAGL